MSCAPHNTTNGSKKLRASAIVWETKSTDKALVMCRAECESGLEERKQMSRTAVRRRSAWPATSAIFDCSFHSLMQPSEYGMIEQASHAISVSARRQVDLPQLPQ